MKLFIEPEVKIRWPGKANRKMKTILSVRPYLQEYFDLPWNQVEITIEAGRKPTAKGIITNGYSTYYDDIYHIRLICNGYFRTEDETIETLGHELTHLVQFYKGSLRYSKYEGFVFWNQMHMPLQQASQGHDFDIYRNSPWEKEAHENGAKFLAHVRSKQKTKPNLIERILRYFKSF